MKRKDEGETRNMENSVPKETTKKNEKKVEFSLHAPWAKEVFLAGEFNQWDIRSMPMKRGKDGSWKAKASLLPGRYEYKFFADQQWVENLSGKDMASNPFGTQNLILLVR
jgi:1,4-alpha-glucan branching enzyme